jgi:type III secretion protein O
MSAYPLAMLMGVCRLREDAAALAARTAEANLRAERERERRLRREREEYRRWRLAEEDRRYGVLIGKDSNAIGMNAFRGELAELKDRELAYDRAAIESKKLQAGLAKRAAEARTAYLAAIQKSRKIDSHREKWREDWDRERIRLEDIEMEEFAKGTIGPAR